MRGQALPPEVFYSYVLPDLLSEYLHRYLLYSERPEWNPFSTLPLVSRHFRASCRTLCVNIFGLEHDEGGSVISDILDKAKDLWDQANLDPMDSQPMGRQYTFQQLMSSNSLIQVYMCTALAKSFLNVDVLWAIQMEDKWNAGDFDDADEDVFPVNHAQKVNIAGFFPRRFRLRDDLMHRAHLPLTCALKLCDCVRPERVTYMMANYLAGVMPRYATVPLMLKHTQDLELYILREHGGDVVEPQGEPLLETLNLIRDLKNFLGKMQRLGKLVKSFNPSSCVPMRVLYDTNIINVLETVANVDWGLHTEDVHSFALDIRDDLLQAQDQDEE